MTQKEATQILAILKAAYPNSYRGMTKEEAIGTVNVWAVQFAKMPADIVLLAVNKCIATSQFPPAPSEVKKKFQSLHWEALEALKANEVYSNLNEEQIKYYKYIKDKTEIARHLPYEPTIEEIKSQYELIYGDNQLLLGG
jgi:hypothetical protein